MLKEFVEHIQKTALPMIEDVGGRKFAIGPNGAKELLPTIDRPDTLPLHSLDALVKLVKTEALPYIETEDYPLYITIPSPVKVLCFSSPCENVRCFRQVFYEACATDVPGFSNGWRDYEKFIIELRSAFAPNEGTEYLLDILSNVSLDNSVSTTDNGITQNLEVKKGIALKTKVQLKPIVSLRPYRTFQEVEQPESEFLVRAADSPESGLRIGLFEADGGMWRLTARQTIKAFLEQELTDEIEAGSVVVAL